MKKIVFLGLLAVSPLALGSCSSDDDDGEESSVQDILNGESPTDVSGDVANFDISIDTSALAETETVPSGDKDYVENHTFDRQVSIAYNGASASVTGSVEGVAVSVSGADVVVNATVDSVCYVLSGSTTDGSFKVYSEKKFKLLLNGVNISNSRGAAINVQQAGRVFVVLADATVNTLADGTSYTDVVSGEDMKGCFFSEEQLIFSGKGTLNVTGNCKAAISSDDYIVVRPNTNIHVYANAGNGIRGKDYVRIYGGVINIESTAAGGKGISTDGYVSISGGRTTAVMTGAATYDSSEGEIKGVAGVKADSTFTISGGTLYVKATGKGGKGISTDMQTLIAGGTVGIVTTGKTYSYGSDDSKAKGIKADGNISITGGTMLVKTTGGEGCEGIESKSTITVSDGTIEIYAYDDAINSKYNLYVNGGNIYANSINNDALDANNNLYVNGGNIVAFGSGQPENALDAAEGYSIFINGGNVFAIGGSTAQTSSSSSQASIALNQSLSQAAIGIFNSSGTGVLYMQVPATSLSAVFITAGGMTAGTAYTVKTGCSVSGGTTFNGLNTTGTISGGTDLTTATAALQVGTAMGGGGMPGGNGGGPGRR